MAKAEEHLRNALTSREFNGMLKKHSLRFSIGRKVKTVNGVHTATLHCRGLLNIGSKPIVKIELATADGASVARIIPMHRAQVRPWKKKEAINSQAKAEAVAKILSTVLPREIKVVIPAK